MISAPTFFLRTLLTLCLRSKALAGSIQILAKHTSSAAEVAGRRRDRVPKAQTCEKITFFLLHMTLTSKPYRPWQSTIGKRGVRVGSCNAGFLSSFIIVDSEDDIEFGSERGSVPAASELGSGRMLVIEKGAIDNLAVKGSFQARICSDRSTPLDCIAVNAWDSRYFQRPATSSRIGSGDGIETL